LVGIGLLCAAKAGAQEQPSFPLQPAAHARYSSVGLASWYGNEFRGHATADGEAFNMRSLSAAHRTMPLPSYARVTNLSNGRSIVVRVNDRGPFTGGRMLDVSSRVATLLDFTRRGVAKVRLDYLGKAPPAGKDESALLASLQGPGIPATSPAVRQIALELKAAEARPQAAALRSPYGELVAYPFAEPVAPQALVDGLTFAARALERPSPSKPHSPYGELVAYSPAETVVARWDAAPLP
jgi:rare lipoprotein A